MYCEVYSVIMEDWYHLVGVAAPAGALSANSSWRAEMTVRMTTTEPHRNRISRHIPLQGKIMVMVVRLLCNNIIDDLLHNKLKL